jgi:hypothetical protein
MDVFNKIVINFINRHHQLIIVFIHPFIIDYRDIVKRIIVNFNEGLYCDDVGLNDLIMVIVYLISYSEVIIVMEVVVDYVTMVS